MTLFVGVLGYAVYNKSKTKTNNATITTQTSELCSLLRINTFEQYQEATYIADRASPARKKIIFKQAVLKGLTYIKAQVTDEDYKLFDLYMNQSIPFLVSKQSNSPEFKNASEQLDKLDLKYPKLSDGLEKFATKSFIYDDELIISDAISNGLNIFRDYDNYDDVEKIISDTFAPTLKNELLTSKFNNGIRLSSYEKEIFDSHYENREIFFLKYSDLKDLTPHKLFETQLCKIKYDIENSKITDLTEDDRNTYPFKFIKKLGKEETLKQINQTLKKIYIIPNNNIYDYQLAFISKLTPNNSDGEEEFANSNAPLIYRELQNLYKYKNLTRVYTDPELVKQRKEYVSNYKTCLDKIGVKYSTINNGEEVDETYTNISITNSTTSKDPTECKDRVANEFKQMYKYYVIINLFYQGNVANYLQ